MARAIRMAAHQLAAQVDHSLPGLTQGERGDLRMLPCDMLAWADALDPDGVSIVEPRPHPVIVQFPERRRVVPIQSGGAA